MKKAKNNSGRLRNVVLVVIGLLILTALAFVILQHSKNIKIKLANEQYLKEYITIRGADITKTAKSDGTVFILVVNSGNRIIDSLPLEIEYYDNQGEFLSKDDVDVLKVVGDILMPEKKKVFKIGVSCPEETNEIKVDIKK